MGAFAERLADYLRKTTRGERAPLTQLKTALQADYKKAAIEQLESIATQVEMDIVMSGFSRTGDMISNARIFGFEISQMGDSINIRFGFAVGDEAEQQWDDGGYAWNFFEFPSPNNPNISILPSREEIDDKIKQAYERELMKK